MKKIGTTTKNAPQFVKCPMSIATSEDEKDIRKAVLGRVEVINKKVKHWNVLVNPFKSKKDKSSTHGTYFRACSVINQIAMEVGVGELYAVDQYNL